MKTFAYVLLMSFVCLTGSTLYAFSGGTGSSGDPYLVSTAAELNSIGSSTTYWASYFKLTTNIDMSGYTGTSYNIIGNITTKFTGGFDGNGYTISNLTYTNTAASYVGLIGYTDHATIQNVRLTNVSITTTSGSDTGGLIGCQYYGTMTNCSMSGTVSGYYNAGGLVGNNIYGTLSFCSSTGTVTGYKCVGSLAGKTSHGTISSSYATGNASGDSSVGGLLGYSDTDTISNCYARGSTTGTVGYIGGLVGYNQYSSFTNCYSTGDVDTGDDGWIGGLVGYTWSSGSYSYTACFWDTQTSGTTDGVDNLDPDPSGITGLATTQMQTQSTFTDAGWDFSTVWIRLYDGYPHLRWEAKYSGGSGTVSNPYLISSIPDFYNMTIFPADWDKYFTLTTDLDLSVLSFSAAPIAPDTDNVAGSFQGTYFTGSFNGNGHEFQNLTISAPTVDFVGLFGWVYYNGQVTNLGLTNATISGRMYVGGLAGGNSGTLASCYVTGAIDSSDDYAGGLVGFNSGGTLSSCYSTATAYSSYNAGGLAGYNNASGSVSNSFATGAVSGSYYIGGLIGTNLGSLSTSYANGTADGDHYVGGLTGENTGTISDCYATGAAAGHVFWIPPSNYFHSYYVGGLIGYNTGTVTNCYAQGSATRQGMGGSLYNVGGLVGYNTGPITTCYSSGLVSGSTNVGGMVGYNIGGSSVNSFWDKETSEQASSALGTSKTTAEMKTEITFTGAGWDFSWVDGDSADWVLWVEGQNYPEFSWQPARFAGGSGTTEDPWKISRAQHLLYLASKYTYFSHSYLMIADIDMSAYTGTMYKPIGYSARNFTGTFDGGGHIISNLTYSTTSTSDYKGMFGYTNGATIRNLGLTDEFIHSHGDAVGGLIGYQYRGHIYRCFTTGSVEGADSVGGMVGAELGSIDDSYSTASVTGTGALGGTGGLVGAISGYLHYGVRTCYSAGLVTGTVKVGGLIGYSNSGLVDSSFWNTETSHQPTSDGGTGITTEQMMNRSTFTAAGWDFLGETTNGTDDYWRLCTRGVSYPGLTWSFAMKGDFACRNGTTMSDFPYLAQHWLLTGCTYSNDYCGWADMNVNGYVDTADLMIFAENWLQ